MPRNPLFSTYRQGENRVTSSILAVFERIGIDRVETLLGAASGETSIGLVEFDNQLGRPDSVPDASIRADFHYLFEVKTTRNALRERQLRDHLKSFDTDAKDKRLFVLTPDSSEPAVIAAIGDERVLWLNFVQLVQAINDLVADSRQLVSDQERFLLRELEALFEADGLLSTDDVVVVAARVAYDEYLDCHAYICQPGRSFRDGIERLAFYRHGAIQPEIPRIRLRRDHVLFSAEHVNQLSGSNDPLSRQLATLIQRKRRDGSRAEGQHYQVFLLSSPDDDETIRLDQPITHPGPGAFVQGQRYAKSERLRAATTTADLRGGIAISEVPA